MEDIWFGLETKVRALMKELLEPTIRRVIESKETTEKILKTQETFSTRIDDIDMNVGKYSRKIGSIDEISKKITEFDSSIRLMELRFSRDREEIKTEISTFNSKIINFEEYLNVFEHMKEGIRNDITNLTHSLQVNKTQSEDKFLTFREEYRDKLQDLESNIVKFDVKLLQYEKNFKNLGKEIGDTSTLIQTTAYNSAELGKKNKELAKSLKKLKNNVFDSIEKLRLILIKNMNDYQTADKKLLELIEKDANIKNRLMIDDILFGILSDPYEKYNLACIEKDYYLNISEFDFSNEIRESIMKNLIKMEEILQTPLPDKPDLSAQYPDSVSRTGRRRGRQRTVFVIKKNESDSPSLKESGQHKQSHRHSLDSGNNLDKINEESFDEDSENNQSLSIRKPRDNRKSEMINLKDYEVLKDEIQIARYNTLRKIAEIGEEDAYDSSFDSSVSYPPPIDYHPIIQEVKDLILLKISEMEANHNKYFESINESIANIHLEIDRKYKLTMMAIDKSSIEANKNLRELELIINQTLAECTSAITMRKRDQSHFNIEIKALNQKAENIEGQYGQIHEKMDSINKNMEYISETLRVTNVLIKQDEFDRESIALMGYKETKNNKTTKQVISIDKQCLSCTGQASVVLTAFKIACLAYSPSPVYYKDSVFTRKELIELQAKIISSLRQEKHNYVASIIEDIRAGRSKTASNVRITRPLSVPSSNFTLQTPRADFSLDVEFPPVIKRNGNFLSTSMNS